MSASSASRSRRLKASYRSTARSTFSRDILPPVSPEPPAAASPAEEQRRDSTCSRPLRTKPRSESLARAPSSSVRQGAVRWLADALLSLGDPGGRRQVIESTGQGTHALLPTRALPLTRGSGNRLR